MSHMASASDSSSSEGDQPVPTTQDGKNSHMGVRLVARENEQCAMSTTLGQTKLWQPREGVVVQTKLER